MFLPLAAGGLTGLARGNVLSVQISVMLARPAALPIAGCNRQRPRCSRRCRSFPSLFLRGYGPFGREIVASCCERDIGVCDVGVVCSERTEQFRSGGYVYSSSSNDEGVHDLPTNRNVLGEAGNSDSLARDKTMLGGDLLAFDQSSVMLSVRDKNTGVAIDGAGGTGVGVEGPERRGARMVTQNVTTLKAVGQDTSGDRPSEVDRPSAADNGPHSVEEASDKRLPRRANDSSSLSPDSRSASQLTMPDTFPRKTNVRPKGDRHRLRWGINIDLEVPAILEELVWGPWDPNGDLWARQVDMAKQVISRSDGVVFLEQLAPILNPREGPPKDGLSRERSREGSTVVDETIVIRLLSELDGIPEVTSDGDILYVFSGLARGSNPTRSRRDDCDVATGTFSARPEVLRFEEIPGLSVTLPKLQEEVPKVTLKYYHLPVAVYSSIFWTTVGLDAPVPFAWSVASTNFTFIALELHALKYKYVVTWSSAHRALISMDVDCAKAKAAYFIQVVASFFQRTALLGIAVFISQCLLLLKLIFGASPAWLFVGPLYLAWVAVDESLKGSRKKSARERDRWREEWAQVCRGDGETVWRKWASARLRARRLLEDEI